MFNAAIDVPDERDIPFAPVFGNTTSETVPFPINDFTILDQGAEYVTRMACTRYGIGHIGNIQSLVIADTQPYNPKDLWLEYLKTNPEAEANGATLQSALKQGKDDGVIGGFTKIESTADLDYALSKGHYCYTGSQNGDWNMVRNTRIYGIRTDNAIIGHVWIIVKKNDSGDYIAVNSYGEDNGYFTVPKELIGTTFTKYAITPLQDLDLLLSYRKKLMSNISIESAKEALKNNLWNGERPTESATREEVAAMIQRAVDLISKK